QVAIVLGLLLVGVFLDSLSPALRSRS
ncbi:MAG: hypothetical protein K0S88_5878, partial [Actinomycetia bacterium]|nr:hypothetical protein [Actinomycetes bacterium]